MLDNVTKVRDQAIADIEAAWQIRAQGGEIIIGMPRLPIEAVPYSIIRLDNVPGKFDGVQSRSEALTFEIVGRFEIPPAPIVLEDYKVHLAQKLGDILVYNGKFIAGANLTQITNVVFIESDDPQYPVFEVALRYAALMSGVPALVRPSS